MRNWLFSGMLLMLAFSVGSTQELKKKGKDEKDLKKITYPEVKEIAGKPFSAWVKAIHSEDPSDRESAIKTILNFGPEKAYLAVPDILKELEKNKTIPVDLNVRVNGILALTTIFQHQEKPDPKYLKEAAALFRSSIRDKQTILKVRSLQALPFLGPTARDALTEVVETIHDPISWEVRQVAIQTLSMLARYDPKGPPPPRAMNALFAALKDNSSLVRYAALQAIPVVGYNLPEAEKGLFYTKMTTMAKDDSRSTVRIQAYVSLIVFRREIDDKGHLSAEGKIKHLDPICALTKSPDPTTRLNALNAICAMGTAAQTAIPFVTAAIHDKDPNIAVTAMMTLICLRAYGAESELKNMQDNESVSPALREACENVIDQLHAVKLMEEKQKKEAKEKKAEKK